MNEPTYKDTDRYVSDILNEYHNNVVTRLQAAEGYNNFDDEQGIHYDACQELAIDLLANAGLDEDTLDDMGVIISADVQILLTLAMFRSPQLRESFEALMES